MGAGTAGSGTKETWRTGVVFTMEWIVSTSYVAVGKSAEGFRVGHVPDTLVFVPIDLVSGCLRVCLRHGCEVDREYIWEKVKLLPFLNRPLSTISR
jgi:hypothetical protein